MSRAAGMPLALHGHGLRSRDQWGPIAVGAAAAVIEVACRRYRCLRCKAVLVVAPAGVLPQYRYSAAAIALALALWGALMFSPRRVRARVSPWQQVGATAASGWASLWRWARSIRAGRLFVGVRALPEGARLRDVAERAATTLAARAATSAELMPLETRAVLGACT